MKKEERVFNILNKWDRIWTASKSKTTFCELYKEVVGSSELSDLELTKKLDEYIDLNKIK